jgi:hypothetical protein
MTIVQRRTGREFPTGIISNLSSAPAGASAPWAVRIRSFFVQRSSILHDGIMVAG